MHLGVNDETERAWQASQHRILGLLEAHFSVHDYVLGGRPSLGDFGLMGPLYAHLYRDAVSGFALRTHFPLVCEWVERTNGEGALNARTYDQKLYSLGPGGELIGRPANSDGAAWLPDDTVPESLLPVVAVFFEEMWPVLVSAIERLTAFIASDAHEPGSELPGKTFFADPGFGEPMNVARTVQVMEDAGVAGIHLEDQVNPKRCGHLDGKEVVDEQTALKRIRAAASARRDPDFLIMARTDIRGVEGMSAAIDRAKALVDAGADAIFPEAMASLEEFAAIRAAVDVPVLANMTEFGKSELFTTAQLADVGVNIVIFPVSLLRLAMGAAERGLDTILAEGSLTSKVPEMQTRARLYELVDYAAYGSFDDNIFTFDLNNNRS